MQKGTNILLCLISKGLSTYLDCMSHRWVRAIKTNSRFLNTYMQ